MGRDPGGDLACEALLAGGEAAPSDPRIEPDDLAWLFDTSGTTGHPEGAMLTHRNLVTMVESFLLDLHPARPDDVLLHAAPITHGSGLCAFHHIARGAASAFPASGSLDSPRTFEAIARHRVTTRFLAPTMLHLLASHPERPRHDRSRLQTIPSGGGPMYVDPLQSAVRAFGPVLVQLVGQAEAPMTCTCLPREAHVPGDDPAGVARLTSAGRETPAGRVAIVDDAGRLLPPGETGEIVVRGDLVMPGYRRKPEATAEALRHGWLHTGDVGHLDAGAYLFLTDRRKDLIMSGGATIDPREVEEALCCHPAIHEAAGLGVPDATWGESVKALVVVREGMRLTPEEAIEHCRQPLARTRGRPRSGACPPCRRTPPARFSSASSSSPTGPVPRAGCEPGRAPRGSLAAWASGRAGAVSGGPCPGSAAPAPARPCPLPARTTGPRVVTRSAAGPQRPPDARRR